MDIPTEPGLYVDHHGGLHFRPADQPAQGRRGIHAVLRHEDAILLVRPPDAEWLELPGGGVERHESVGQALRRELLEEAGVDLPLDRLRSRREVRLQSRYFSSNHNAFWLYDQSFRLVILPVRPTLQQPGERGHQRLWVPVDAIARQTLHHVHRLGLERLLAQ